MSFTIFPTRSQPRNMTRRDTQKNFQWMKCTWYSFAISCRIKICSMLKCKKKQFCQIISSTVDENLPQINLNKELFCCRFGGNCMLHRWPKYPLKCEKIFRSAVMVTGWMAVTQIYTRNCATALLQNCWQYLLTILVRECTFWISLRWGTICNTYSCE